jgi:membrane-associated protease RseP (regulator of RpoE activity)
MIAGYSRIAMTMTPTVAGTAFSTRRLPFTAFLLLALNACASYEPAVIVPAITLSAEDTALTGQASSSGWDLGLEVSANESDSLFNLEVLPGIRVRSVQQNGPAARAGLQSGDVILEANGIDTNSPDALAAITQQSDSADFNLQVQRGTTVFAVPVQARQLNNSAAATELFRLDPIATRAGYRTVLMDRQGSQSNAVEVVELFPNSPLAAANIRPGDRIVALDSQAVGSAQELVNRLNQDYALGSDIRLTLLSGDTQVEKTLQLWDPGRRLSRLHLGPLFNYENSLDPSATTVSLLNLWFFSVYQFQRSESERSHSLLGLFTVESGLGELTEVDN